MFWLSEMVCFFLVIFFCNVLYFFVVANCDLLFCLIF